MSKFREWIADKIASISHVAAGRTPTFIYKFATAFREHPFSFTKLPPKTPPFIYKIATLFREHQLFGSFKNRYGIDFLH